MISWLKVSLINIACFYNFTKVDKQTKLFAFVYAKKLYIVVLIGSHTHCSYCPDVEVVFR